MDRYIQVERPDSSQFWVTIPGLPDGRPHKVCHYHYTTTGKKDENDKLILKHWWGALEWNPTYNPLNPMTWSWILTPEGKRSKDYWDAYTKNQHNKAPRLYGCYSIPPKDTVNT